MSRNSLTTENSTSKAVFEKITTFTLPSAAYLEKNILMSEIKDKKF